jgi:hypothetical protein
MLRNVREVNKCAMDIIKNEKSLRVILDKLYELEKSLKDFTVIVLDGYDLGLDVEQYEKDYLFIFNVNTEKEMITDVTDLMNSKEV